MKHLIDVIVQPGLTFSFSPTEGYKGLVTGKKAAAVYARGGAYGPGTGGSRSAVIAGGRRVPGEELDARRTEKRIVVDERVPRRNRSLGRRVRRRRAEGLRVTYPPITHRLNFALR